MKSLRSIVALGFGLATFAGTGVYLLAQDSSRPTFRVKVDMVVLGFTVTDISTESPKLSTAWW